MFMERASEHTKPTTSQKGSECVITESRWLNSLNYRFFFDIGTVRRNKRNRKSSSATESDTRPSASLSFKVSANDGLCAETCVCVCVCVNNAIL